MAYQKHTVFSQQNPGDAWKGDFSENRDANLPGGIMVDPAQFPADDKVDIVVNGAHLAAVTSVTVDALTGPVPAGSVIKHSAGKYIKTTAAAAAGATTLAVEATAFALADNDPLTYAGSGLRRIPSGTPIGRTFAERDAGALFGPGASTDDEFYLLANDIPDADMDAEGTAYRPTKLVKENLLPGWSTMAAGLKAKIRATYQTIVGVD